MQSKFFSLFFIFCASNVWANSVAVVNVDVTAQGNNQYQFAVSLRHEDGGWDHYANRWEVLDTQGNILATRTLHHPHVNEQPFTRSLSTTLPDTVKTVIIRAHDSVHQYGDKEMKVSLP